MSAEEILFEIDTSREKDKVFAVGVPLVAKLKDVRIYVNGVNISKSMLIETLRIVKVLK